MADSVALPEEWQALCTSSDTTATETIRACIDGLFRRLLANLLLDFDNPKFRQVKKENKAVHRLTQHLPPGFVVFLFTSLGFAEHGEAFTFTGTSETLKRADAVFAVVEQTIDKESRVQAEQELRRLQHAAAERAKNAPAASPSQNTPPAPARTAIGASCTDRSDATSDFHTDTVKDVADAEAVKAAVRKTLLTVGRVRNSFFEARDFTVRRMRRGRVYACSEKCDCECVEAHWHLLTGRNILYAHLAHLSADGTQLLHLGPEHGYQYNTLPGSTNFGKTVHFSEKSVDENGKLNMLKTSDKPATTCIYCGRLFSELFL